jgi:hypothetical protein
VDGSLAGVAAGPGAGGAGVGDGDVHVDDGIAPVTEVQVRAEGVTSPGAADGVAAGLGVADGRGVHHIPLI